MFQGKPHMNIASQVLATIIIFVAFHTYLAKLKTQHHLQYNARAIEKMQSRHYKKILGEKKSANKKNRNLSLEQP